MQQHKIIEQEKYIRRCIQLAMMGKESASPNPPVGAVIVHKGVILGEGYHLSKGNPHAEVNAIASVKEDSLLFDSTLYVSLEPCSHYGSTPPCAELIIKKGIPRVVVGCIDPSSKVQGKGIALLRKAGVEVQVGVLEKECQWLIREFILSNQKRRPYVYLKWAESQDGFLDRKRSDGRAEVLSTELTNLYVHQRRSFSDAILVGRNTALLDNPTLTTRGWEGKNSIRIVLDRNLQLPFSLHLFTDGGTTWVVTEKKMADREKYISLSFDSTFWSSLLEELYLRGVQRLLVEGGAYTHATLLSSEYWDEADVEISKKKLGQGVTAPCFTQFSKRIYYTLFGEQFVKYYRWVDDDLLTKSI